MHLPEDHRIIAVRQADDLSDAIDLRIEGPTLPAVDAGFAIPRVNLMLSVIETDEMVRQRQYVGRLS